MTRKNKDYVPKNMGELEEFFYGPKKDGRNVDLYRQKRYLDWLRTLVLSCAFEDQAKAMFCPLGEMEKIQENQKQPSFDFKIDDRRLLLEVTTLNIDETYPTRLTRQETLMKLRAAIEHVLAKDASPFPSYRKGGVIIYTAVFNLFSKFNRLLDDRLPKTSGMLDNNLDFLAFLHEPASINNESSWKHYTPVFYVKDSFLAAEFKKAFHGKNYKIMHA